MAALKLALQGRIALPTRTFRSSFQSKCDLVTLKKQQRRIVLARSSEDPSEQSSDEDIIDRLDKLITPPPTDKEQQQININNASPADDQPIPGVSPKLPSQMNSTPTTDDQSPSKDGDPVPRLKIIDPDLQLPRTDITKLRDTVFGLDTLFVRSVENYGSEGVLFKGNLRGDPAVAAAKLRLKLKEQLGDTYRLFLLEDQDEQPTAVVIPAASAEFQTASPTVELLLALGLGLTTIATTLNINAAELFNAALLTAKFDPELVSNAIPGTVATLAILLSHELGHFIGAKQANLKLAPPIPIPAGLGLLGTFGSITRISSTVPNRTALATVTAPGPLAGAAVSTALLLTGLVMTQNGVGGLEVDSASFRESLLVGSLTQLVFGDRVFTAESLNCNPLFIAGWAGLIINSINSLPAGELDGGRLFLSLFGRRAASRMSAATFFLIGIGGFTNSLALFWLLLVLTLQRGPIVPCEEELTPLPEGSLLKFASIVALLVPFLVLLPYPFAPTPIQEVLIDGMTAMPPQLIN
jgi:membrane-associated protease RseP (regulator of RpoE activity)